MSCLCWALHQRKRQSYAFLSPLCTPPPPPSQRDNNAEMFPCDEVIACYIWSPGPVIWPSIMSHLNDVIIKSTVNIHRKYHTEKWEYHTRCVDGCLNKPDISSQSLALVRSIIFAIPLGPLWDRKLIKRLILSLLTPMGFSLAIRIYYWWWFMKTNCYCQSLAKYHS